MLRVRQRFESDRVGDVEAAVRAELARIRPDRRISKGQSVAITAGSRGIASIVPITRTLVAVLRELGARPFLVPAMGSHGGATADGQIALLAKYGITEQSVGAPIRSTMETVCVGTTEDGIPIHFDRHAFEADHVVLVNRIKPHTSFNGEIESGLMKMMMIGLGKHAGATIYHRAIVTHSFDRIVRTVGRRVLRECRIAFGLALVENAYDQTARIEAVDPEQIETREKDLLVLANRLMPHLPLDRIDLLVVDEMGKNISGQGMDTNVTGRKVTAGPDAPRVTRIFVRSLTPETGGNAHGIGQADFATTRLVDAICRKTTAINSLTAVNPTAARIPIHFATDREAIETALGTIGLTEPEQARVVRVRNTLHLADVQVSEPCRDELARRDGIEILGEPRDLVFDEGGNLPPFA
jgi:antitoxin (DNA-binding transcriptional repressor) of toxin-antitoxin stability system